MFRLSSRSYTSARGQYANVLAGFSAFWLGLFPVGYGLTVLLTTLFYLHLVTVTHRLSFFGNAVYAA